MDRDDKLNNIKSAEQNKVSKALPKKLLLHSKEVIAAVVIGVIITVLSTVILDNYYPETELEEKFVLIESLSQSQIGVAEPSHRNYLIRAGLANVLASISPVKMQIQMHFQMMGEFPTKQEDINISAFDLDEHEQIKSSFMTKEGGVGVYLANTFGDEKYLVLQPNASKSGAFIKWRCLTNVDEKYLGIPKSRLCEFQENM